MKKIQFKGAAVHVYGSVPSVGSRLRDFVLTTRDLDSFASASLTGKSFIMNVFPSLDTAVCALSVRRFNEAAEKMNIPVLCISADLPFAQNRFCQENKTDNVVYLSNFRSPDFGRDLGLLIVDSPLAGLLCRAVFVIDESGVIRYVEQVPEISREPDYDSALEALRSGGGSGLSVPS